MTLLRSSVHFLGLRTINISPLRGSLLLSLPTNLSHTRRRAGREANSISNTQFHLFLSRKTTGATLDQAGRLFRDRDGQRVRVTSSLLVVGVCQMALEDLLVFH